MSKRSHILITVFIALLILTVMLIVAIIRDQSATEPIRAGGFRYFDCFVYDHVDFVS